MSIFWLLTDCNDATSLQRLCIQAREGVNVAIGIAELQLRSTAN